MILPYQDNCIKKISRLAKNTNSKYILEIGSDLNGLVAFGLAENTGSFVVGINPISSFPKQQNTTCQQPPVLLRADGRNLPFEDNSFDAVFSIATLEHVNGLDLLLDEIYRVLKPMGFFYTQFSPIWSCAIGHHVYAIHKDGAKEARFWKAGRNPIPDYAHLYMTPDELRDYLRKGPCVQELIDPIINWIYKENSINRYHFEKYITEFKNSPFFTQQLTYKTLNDRYPDKDTKDKLTHKYGKKANFSYSGFTVLLRKPALSTETIKSILFKKVTFLRYMSNLIIFHIDFQLAKRFPELRYLKKRMCQFRARN